MKRILIVFHEYQRPRRGLLIQALGGAWQDMGLQVSCIYGIGERAGADLLIPQIDLTHTPPEYVEFIRSFPNVANRDVIDISKRRISTHLLSAGDDYPGPVIVKTDCNHGGIPEYGLSAFRRPVLARVLMRTVPMAERACGRRLAWRRVLKQYPIYNTLADVPAGVFQNPALVVERFLPEKEGNRYFMRHYLCLGEHERNVRVAGPTPFLKRSECVLVDEGLPVPDQVRGLRRRLGLDYGKIDYTLHDGQVVILDVNRTPGTPGTDTVTARAVGDLAGGILSLLSQT